MNEKLIDALSYRTIHYVLGCNDIDSDSPSVPYEVVFTMPQWKKVLEALKETGIDAF
jgi:hypothetical protein